MPPFPCMMLSLQSNHKSLLTVKSWLCLSQDCLWVPCLLFSRSVFSSPPSLSRNCRCSFLQYPSNAQLFGAFVPSYPVFPLFSKDLTTFTKFLGRVLCFCAYNYCISLQLTGRCLLSRDLLRVPSIRPSIVGWLADLVVSAEPVECDV